MKDYFQKNKLSVAAFFALLGISIISGTYACKQPLAVETRFIASLQTMDPASTSDTETNETIRTPQSQSIPSRPPVPSSLDRSQGTPPHGGGEPPPPSQLPEPASTSVTLRIDVHEQHFEYREKILKGATVYGLMKQMRDTGQLTFSAKNYGELGYMIDGINGVANSTAIKKYWIYYINGNKAKIGVSAYSIQEGDVIEWKYEDEE